MKLIDYIQGKRRGKAANELEREAMNDPFLQDAIDGFDAVPGDHLSTIQDLENQLQQKLTKRKQVINYRLWAVGVAASVILLLGIGGLLRYEMQKPENTAFRVPKTVVIPPKDTIGTLNQHTEPPQKVLAQHIVKPVSHSTIETKPEMKEMLCADSKETVVMDVLKSNSDIAEIRSAKVENVMQNVESKKTDSTMPSPVQQELSGKVSGVAVTENIGLNKNAPNAKSDMMFGSVNGINRKVSGRVFDAKGEPVIGATVKIRGKNKGVVTDINGEFELPATIGKDKLEATYIGYDKKEILAKADSNIIRMNESQLALNEVVVVGYGTRKMTSMTGAVTANRNDKKVFGEKEFRKYYDQHRSQNICVDSIASIQASFYIDKSGTPTELIVQKSTCEVLTKEFTRLLTNSPKWTTLNRRVELRLELK